MRLTCKGTHHLSPRHSLLQMSREVAEGIVHVIKETGDALAEVGRHHHHRDERKEHDVANQGLRAIRTAITPTESTPNWTIWTKLSPAKDWTARTSSMQRLINWPVGCGRDRRKAGTACGCTWRCAGRSPRALQSIRSGNASPGSGWPCPRHC